ncbi:uncharacterized protein PG998_009099 [Apiospora kogelbergensis]|uniref:uncharacterized protein n=1 Tax=Apiospora kogelbergensis TaxID=1337665 RepID=UPI00312DBE26
MAVQTCIKKEEDENGPSTTSRPSSPSAPRRTLNSSLFGTRAGEMVSAYKFIWSKEQTKLFEAFIRDNYPNHLVSNLSPLLKSLDLDGYEDIRTEQGENLHELIVRKVIYKIHATRRSVVLADESFTDKRSAQALTTAKRAQARGMERGKGVKRAMERTEGKIAPPVQCSTFSSDCLEDDTDSSIESIGEGSPGRHTDPTPQSSPSHKPATPTGGGGGGHSKSTRQGHIERMEDKLLDFGLELKEAQWETHESEEYENEVDSMRRLYSRLVEKLKKLELLPSTEA